MGDTLQGDFEWTAEHEQKMMDFWNSRPNNPPSLKELTVHIFGDGYDGRSIEAKALQRALARHNIKARTLTDYVPKTPQIELSLAHKQYIENNVVSIDDKTYFFNEIELILGVLQKIVSMFP